MVKFFSNLLAILFGFFLSTLVSTILSQTGDWSILSASFLVATIELLNKSNYNTRKNTISVTFFNNIKIGFMYGLFVEAFKLGS